MNWAFKRRTKIVLLLLSIFLIVVVIPYAISRYEPPSCVDGKQNQGELGVDCSGPCKLQCKGTYADLRILWLKLFPVRAGSYDAAAHVENSNLNVGTPSLPYTFRVYGANRELISERKGVTYAAPGERIPLFEGNILTGDKVPASVELEFDPDTKWVTAERKLPIFTVTDKTMTGVTRNPRLTAKLTNDIPEVVRGIDLSAFLYDKDGSIVAASASYVDQIEKNESRQVVFTWPKPFEYNAETESCGQPVDVILAVDRSGSMASDGKNPPQPLTQAKQAAAAFVDRMNRITDQVAFVSFATNATIPIDQPLSQQFDVIKAQILKTEIGQDGVQYTNLGEAIQRAHEEFRTLRRNEDAKQVLVLLTDGEPTYPKDPANPKRPEQYAREKSERLKQDGITLYTIGLGDELNERLLIEMASGPESYYKAASGAELADIYGQIASAICVKAPPVIEIIPRLEHAGFTL
ncbi:MAG TPA: vWA domain-containing protein [Candidatus Paceibacterota bacterium]|nr:vWA domain-containing protein [Candidatus Paceibacterota bacterium]